MDASSLLAEVHTLSMPGRAYLWKYFKNIQNAKERQEEREREGGGGGKRGALALNTCNPINVTKHIIVGTTTLHEDKVRNR